MNILKNISFFIILSVLLNGLSIYIDSSFLKSFLCSNLIIILITLLAINTATTGLLSIKMSELVTRFPKLDFNTTYSEMKFSLKEQIVLIIISLILLIIDASKLVAFECKEFILGTLLTTVFIYSIDILRDTGVAVFDLLELANKIEDQKEK